MQVIEVDSFKVTHATRYQSGVTSLGISPDCGTMVVGLTDNQIMVRRHQRPRVITSGPSAAPIKRQRYQPRLTAANFR
jgi:U3 small nucleolar RNA-associated protein 15